MTQTSMTQTSMTQAPYRERMSRMRKIIASRMVESLQTSAQLTSVVEVDVSGVAELRARVKDDFRARHGVGLSYLPFFALATVQALAEHRVVNAAIVPETHEIEYHPAQHLGIAVDTDRGLMVPVIRNAQDLDLAGLATAISRPARGRTNSGRTRGAAARSRSPTPAAGVPCSTPRSSTRRSRRSSAPARSCAGRSRYWTPMGRSGWRFGRWSTSRSPMTTASSTVPTPHGS
jgi:hypothetical protein